MPTHRGLSLIRNRDARKALNADLRDHVASRAELSRPQLGRRLLYPPGLGKSRLDTTLSACKHSALSVNRQRAARSRALVERED